MRIKGLVIALLASISAHAQDLGRADGMRFVPNVEEQFRALTEFADPFGFNIADSPNPSSCKHYQGMVRVEAADGTPYFLVTRSGNHPSTVPPGGCHFGDSPNETGHGHLIVVRLGSRLNDGERLRSNRLRKGRISSHTEPRVSDKATTYFTVVGGVAHATNPAFRPGLVPRDGDGSPMQLYQHPGGMQVVGKMLAVALESPTSSTLPATQIMFFDVSDPEQPVFRSQYTPVNGAGQTRASAGTVAITPLESGRYLMMTTGGPNTTWYYYRSTLDDLSSPNLSWDYVGSHPAPVPLILPNPPGIDPSDFAGSINSHQTLQFIREGSIRGKLYIAGARGNFLLGDLFNLADLFLIEAETDEFLPGETLTLTTRSANNRMSAFPASGGSQLASLAAASTFYVTPTGDLLFYATTHDNEGPAASIEMGEWRHIDMTRPHSPTLQPTFEIDAPFEVEEGGQTSLTGSVEDPLARAWVQLFHEPDFGGPSFKSQSVVVDFDDRGRDDFENLTVFDFHSGDQPRRHSNRARSLKWYAPFGCTIRLQDFGDGAGPATMTLTGNSQVQVRTELGSFDEKIDGVTFGPDCESYYSKRFELAWDSDRNGSYEAGTPATFSAAGLEGPSTVNVPVRIRHPDVDVPKITTSALVIIHNARPRVREMRLGGITPPFPANSPPRALMGLPVTVDATFTDAGVRDRQVASINWGDGTVEAHTTFASYSDAFGGVTGSLSHSHRFTAAGSRQIVLTVRDDDGGVISSMKGVLVESPADWISVVITRLDTLIAATTDDTARQHMESARQALAGSPKRPTDGALHMIAIGNFIAAMDLVNASMASLRAAGSEAETLTVPLEQVVASLQGLSRAS